MFAVFALQSKNIFENVVINYVLILQPCLAEMFALNVQNSIISEVLK